MEEVLVRRNRALFSNQFSCSIYYIPSICYDFTRLHNTSHKSNTSRPDQINEGFPYPHSVLLYSALNAPEVARIISFPARGAQVRFRSGGTLVVESCWKNKRKHFPHKVICLDVVCYSYITSPPYKNLIFWFNSVYVTIQIWVGFSVLKEPYIGWWLITTFWLFVTLLYRRPMLVDLDDPDSVMEVITRLERSLLRNSDYEQ